MDKETATSQIPSVRLFTAPGCPHCDGVKLILEQLYQEGRIGEVALVDITLQPEVASELGIRTVPWLEMGSLTFTGEQSLQALREWATRLAEPEAMVDYYQQLLANGELAIAEQMLQKNPDTLPTLLTLMVRDGLPLQVRIGIVALFEGVAGKPSLQALIPELSTLGVHEDYRIRADIAHLLQLTDSIEAITPLEILMQDVHPEVREIAADAVEELVSINN